MMRSTSSRTLLLAAAFPLLAAPGALAQENTITIEQRGSGNTLTVDQSDATGSTVGGLTLDDFTNTGELFINGAPRFVPDEDGDPSDVPRVVSGPGLTASPTSQPAQQLGNDNVASVTITGDSGVVGLLQNNSDGGAGNSATVSLNGDGSALVGQEGAGNEANLSVAGTGALGSILQRGDGNFSALEVSGVGARGTISQLGDGNNSALDLSGTDGSSVSYVLQGNGVTTTVPVQVITNGASVTITQTPMAGF